MFNIRIKELRKQNKISQKTLSANINLSERRYQDLENDRSKPSHDTLLAIANYFDVSTDYLLGRTNNPNSHKL